MLMDRSRADSWPRHQLCGVDPDFAESTARRQAAGVRSTQPIEVEIERGANIESKAWSETLKLR